MRHFENYTGFCFFLLLLNAFESLWSHKEPLFTCSQTLSFVCMEPIYSIKIRTCRILTGASRKGSKCIKSLWCVVSSPTWQCGTAHLDRHREKVLPLLTDELETRPLRLHSFPLFTSVCSLQFFMYFIFNHMFSERSGCQNAPETQEKSAS